MTSELLEVKNAEEEMKSEQEVKKTKLKNKKLYRRIWKMDRKKMANEIKTTV